MLKVKNIILFIGFIGFGVLNAKSSDSLKIVHTDIHLSIRDFSQKTISGFAKHKVVFYKASNVLKLDLSSLTVDSVKIDSVDVTFSHLNSKLTINLPSIIPVNDSFEVSIFYKGQPAADPSGWGGFYFSGDYAFNLGVGFQVNPHSFGRAWFPCIDEFDIKSSYDLFIETDTQYVAACNGVLMDVQVNQNSKIWHYHESRVMSAYLVAVSVSKFTVLNDVFNGVNSTFPVQLYCLPKDTFNVSKSFENLPFAIQSFEEAFGPQAFSKVGYNFVPFSMGAMEHAGNITYPNLFANGTKNYEKLMAHELSHHWWGNLVTCKDAEDMWLNEGWASYCEHFFLQKMYGQQAYTESINANHLDVLRYAHINDNQVFSMVNIPSEFTYGSHVYKKGADVIHALRNTLGDSVFFKACQAYLSLYQYGNASTDDMQKVFENNGGGQVAVDFFNSVVKEKGFPHVIINRQVHSGNGPYDLKIFTFQKPRFNQIVYKNLSVELSFFKNDTDYVTRHVFLNNQLDSFEFAFDFRPVYVAVDLNQKMSDAITDAHAQISQIGEYDFPETFSKVIVKKTQGNSMVRVEHHWVGPELYEVKAPYKSKYRYLTLDGVWSDSLAMDLEMIYDGRQGSVGNGFLDHTLIFKTEDSLRVMYRGFPGDYWREWTDLVFTFGNKNDKQGKVKILNAKKGDYVFAMYDHQLSFHNPEIVLTHTWKVQPNPATSYIKISFFTTQTDTESIVIYDVKGNEKMRLKREASKNQIEVDISSLISGVYTIQWTGNGFVKTEKIVIE